MNAESKRISGLFADLYSGTPWTEIKLTDILNNISAEEAAKHPIANANSIWQLVQHCIGWRENVLRKLKGESFQSPADNYLSEPPDTGDAAWQSLLQQLALAESNWENWLNTLDDELLAQGYIPSNNKFTVYQVIHGILHHDNYHFGQILMLKKSLACN